MNRRGHRGRTDGNHTAIVEALRACGARVHSLAGQGDGCPDLLVLSCGRVLLVEVKSKGGKLTNDQKCWLGDGWPIVVVTSPEEAIQVLRG